MGPVPRDEPRHGRRSAGTDARVRSGSRIGLQRDDDHDLRRFLHSVHAPGRHVRSQKGRMADREGLVVVDPDRHLPVVVPGYGRTQR